MPQLVGSTLAYEETNMTLTALRTAVAAAERRMIAARDRKNELNTKLLAAKAARGDEHYLELLALSRGGPRRNPGAEPPPKTKLQIAQDAAQGAFDAAENAFVSASNTLSTAQSELLHAENKILNARRVELARRIIDGDDTAAAELLELCPSDYEVRIDQRFDLSPLVQHALNLIQGRTDPVNTPVDQLRGDVAGRWPQARARVLAAA
jgi:hypothetical protein